VTAWSGWTCHACGNDGNLAFECDVCPALVDARLAPMVEIARASRQLAAAPRVAAPVARRRTAVAAGILSARTTARRLGIGRDTLARLVAAGLIAPVPKGSRQGYRARDVEALIERGYSLPEAAPRPEPKRSRHRTPKSNGTAQVHRIADLNY